MTRLAAVLGELRKRLDEQYLESRSRGAVVENRLEGYFLSAEPSQNWHQVMDLLILRHFQLIDRDTDRCTGTMKERDTVDLVFRK
jgi:hypothetical protein